MELILMLVLDHMAILVNLFHIYDMRKLSRCCWNTELTLMLTMGYMAMLVTLLQMTCLSII